MSKKELELKSEDFFALKGKVTKIDKDKKELVVSLSLEETFQNPSKKSMDIKLIIGDDTVFKKIEIVIEGGEVEKGEDEADAEEIKFNDIKKHQNTLISLTNPEKLFEIEDLEEVEVEEILVIQAK